MRALRTRIGFHVVTLLAAASAFGVGVHYGTFAASDTDPYGYVSQAELIARGTLRVDQRFALALPIREAEAAFVPPGHKKSTVPGFIVPTFPPGLPLIMAGMLRLTGVRDAVFYVVPLFGALLVWLTARLGRRIHSRLAGVSAAVLLAASPSFLYQVTQPVSDIPAAAWWTLSLLLTLHPGTWAAPGAGAAASMGVLTRPNLVVLIPVLGAFYLWRILRQTSIERRAGTIRLLLFGAGLLPGCLALAAWNDHLYGSPLRSGYPPIAELYAWTRVWPNLDRYPRWLVQTQTPLVCLAAVAPWLVRRHRARSWLLLLFAGVVVASYLPYGVFGREEWSFVRYLLPAYPPVTVLSVAAALDMLRRTRARTVGVGAIWFACVAGLAVWQLRDASERGAFVTWVVERRYVDVGRYVARLSNDAVFIAGLHSGSIRYYSGQLTIDYPNLQPEALEEAFAAFGRVQRRVYVVLDEGEEEPFRSRFSPHTPLGRLDWPAAVVKPWPGPARIYNLADRASFLAGSPVLTHDLGMEKEPIVHRKP